MHQDIISLNNVKAETRHALETLVRKYSTQSPIHKAQRQVLQEVADQLGLGTLSAAYENAQGGQVALR